MFRTKNDIIKIMQRKNFDEEPLAKIIFDMINTATDDEDLANKAFSLIKSDEFYDYTEDVPSVKKIKDTLNTPLTSKEVTYFSDLLEKVRAISTLEYSLYLADLLAPFRKNAGMMKIVVTAYNLYKNYYPEENIAGLTFRDACENLAILYGDEDCVCYDLSAALPCFIMRFGGYVDVDSKDPEVLYEFAMALDRSNNFLYRSASKTLLAKAAKAGSAKARQYYMNMGCCRYCGGTFKGLFSKKCSVCGRPKDY